MLQGSLLAAGEMSVNDVALDRIEPAEGSWLELGRGLLGGADDLLYELISSTEWKVGRRVMFDRVLDDPRLSRWYRPEQGDPHPVLQQVREWAENRYSCTLGGAGLNYYRDGSDSVAFHADRELRDLRRSVVVILVLGEQRPFLVRPQGGGRSIDLAPGSGDVIVMGGRCQADFEHSVPKSARRIGPRLSVSWRWSPGPTPTVLRRDGYFESRSWRSLSA